MVGMREVGCRIIREECNSCLVFMGNVSTVCILGFYKKGPLGPLILKKWALGPPVNKGGQFNEHFLLNRLFYLPLLLSGMIMENLEKI